MLDLIVNVGLAENDSSLLRGSLALARRLPAFLTGLQLVAVYPSLMSIPESIGALDEEQARAQARGGWWTEACKQAGIQGEWEVIRGISIESLAKRSQLADLVIGELRISDPGTPAGFDEITRALFADAAPMLLVPDTMPGDWHTERLVIAWNGSASAAHAVKASLPLLKLASSVHILDGERSGLPGISPPPLPLRAWLQRHGIVARWQPFPAEHDAGQALLESAIALKADLLVMGAWGRSRLSELVLGGATRWLLGHSTVPLLVAR